MVAKLFFETDVIEVNRPPVLFYGQPGSGKTSIAQTSTKSFTLDFDQGLHRSAFRKTGMRFDSWEDVLTVQREGFMEDGKMLIRPGFVDFETIVLDTIGTLLEYMSRSIIDSNPKMGTKAGGLSLQGWGVLKTTFGQWLAGLRQAGKQVVMVAHQKEERDGEEKVLRPDIAGGSYAVVMNNADIIGYISYRNNARFLSWEPCDQYFAKNGARLKSGPVPNFAADPNYLADLLTQARQNLGHTAEASAAAAGAVKEWQDWLNTDPTLDAVHAKLIEGFPKLQNGARASVWTLINNHMVGLGYAFDWNPQTQKGTKKFVLKEGAA